MRLILPLLVFTSIAHASFESDIKAVLGARKGLSDCLTAMQEKPGLFPAQRQPEQLLSGSDRQTCLQLWQSFMDHIVSLDRQAQRYYGRYSSADGIEKSKAQKLRFATFLAQYRHALAFINRCENNPALHKILNEPVKEMGLPKDTYSELKLRFLNPGIAAQFAGLNTLDKLHRLTVDDALMSAIEADKRFIWAAGGSHGTKNTFKNLVTISRDLGFKAWFPIQKGVSDWMGDTKVWRRKSSLITDKQVKELQKKLEPGDVLLIRHEWYLSNIGLPGFWPHAAIYIGTESERKAFFKTLPYDLNAKLQKKCPDAYKKSVAPDEHDNTPRVLEAISEGVIFTTLEHCLEADSAAALRPRLSKERKAEAILRAFHYSGRPYDFNFDFQTDAALVCTELVYKCYEPGKARSGLRLPLVDVMKRKVMPANQLAIVFDRDYGKNQQLDFVAFLDGVEWERRSVFRNVTAFRKSHTRAKWHIWKKRRLQSIKSDPTVAAKLTFTGEVQTEEFQKRVARLAREQGITGWIVKMPDGSALAHFEGSKVAISQVLFKLYVELDAASLSSFELRPDKATRNFSKFTINE